MAVSPLEQAAETPSPDSRPAGSAPDTDTALTNVEMITGALGPNEDGAAPAADDVSGVVVSEGDDTNRHAPPAAGATQAANQDAAPDADDANVDAPPAADAGVGAGRPLSLDEGATRGPASEAAGPPGQPGDDETPPAAGAAATPPEDDPTGTDADAGNAAASQPEEDETPPAAGAAGAQPEDDGTGTNAGAGNAAPVAAGAAMSASAGSSTERAPFHLPPPPEPDTVVAAYGERVHPSAQNRQLPRTLAVANQKGGVGKTTTAVNLGAALAELDYRVLVVDLDPQGNATTGLGINARNLDSSIYDVILHDVPIEDVIEPTTLKNLFVVPATIDLAGAEIELVPVFSRELRLRKALEPVVGDFDFVLIDCPPSLGLLTVNGLAAATEVAVPIQCEYYALEGLGQLLRNVGLVQTNLNGDLEVSTIILTMYDARTKLAEQVAQEVRQYFGDRVCRSVVPRTVRLSEAPSFGQPIIVFDSSSRGSIAYRELAKEVSGGAPKRTR